MNKRLIKKQSNKIIKKIQKLTLKENDFIILEFDMHKIRNDTIQHFFDNVKSKIKTENIIGIPSGISIKPFDKESIIKHLENILENLKNN